MSAQPPGGGKPEKAERFFGGRREWIAVEFSRGFFQQMKRCSYCGKEYADSVTVCPIDGQPVRDRAEGRESITAQPRAAQAAFNAKLVSPISSAGAYRIFVKKGDLIFIQTEGGSKSVLAGVAPLFGPAGNLIPLALWLFGRKKDKARQQQVDEGDPEELLHEGEKNFKLHLAEIREAAIEAPAVLAASGKAGRLNLLVRHGEKIKFEFASIDEMSRAIQLLVPLLNSTLKVNVEWNGEKGRFEKKKNSLTR